MPIRKDMQDLYPSNWKQISEYVRFTREKGRCQNCGRAHGELVCRLSDGRWFDSSVNMWVDKHGSPAKWPDILDYDGSRRTVVYLAAAHKQHDPRINGNEDYDEIAAWCQRCHIMYDQPYHTYRRRITYRARLAMGDLFVGNYETTKLTFAT